MAHNPKPTEPRQPNQSTHSRFHWDDRCTKLISGNDEWYIVSYETMVQIENRAFRLYADFPYKLVVS